MRRIILALGYSLLCSCAGLKQLSPPPAVPDIARKVLCRLSPGPEPWTLKMKVSAVPNATAAPDRTLTLHTGLIEFCGKDEALLAFAIAHEMAHLDARHHTSLRSTETVRITGTLGAALLAGAGTITWPAAGAVALFLPPLTTLPASRRHEHAADSAALSRIIRAGYPPQTGRRFWQKMTLARPHPQGPEWLSGHPLDAHRCKPPH